MRDTLTPRSPTVRQPFKSEAESPRRSPGGASSVAATAPDWSAAMRDAILWAGLNQKS
jgi:hypothetical protein